MTQHELLKLGAIGMTTGGLAVVFIAAAQHRSLARITLGMMGRRRSEALRDQPLFSALEPLTRWLARWVSRVPLGSTRGAVERLLLESGNALGVAPDEFIALTLLTTLLCFGVGSVAAIALASPALGFWGAVCGPAWLMLGLHQRRQRRFLEVDRGLPALIDLAAMCMGAGLDLPGSLRLVVQEGSARAGVLRNEIETVLRELDLGHTRGAALRAMARRVPTRSVHDFVSAIVQAEEKGTPLSEALHVQATVLRGRRTVLAEEAAARAGVLMMLPLLLLLGCVMLIAMGGLVIRGMESGL